VRADQNGLLETGRQQVNEFAQLDAGPRVKAGGRFILPLPEITVV